MGSAPSPQHRTVDVTLAPKILHMRLTILSLCSQPVHRHNMDMSISQIPAGYCKQRTATRGTGTENDAWTMDSEGVVALAISFRRPCITAIEPHADGCSRIEVQAGHVRDVRLRAGVEAKGTNIRACFKHRPYQTLIHSLWPDEPLIARQGPKNGLRAL